MSTKELHLLAYYVQKPKAGVQTQVAGWAKNPDNVQYDERVEITRGLKRDSDMAKIVLNLSTKKVEKNGWSDVRDFNELFKYFFKGYHEYVTTVMSKLDPIYFNTMLDEMQAEHDAANPPAEVKEETPNEATPA